MKRLLAQHDLEAMMTSLSPLLPLVSRKGCEAGTTVLAGLLGEALEAQEAASKRSDDLKQLQPKGLMELFTPEKGNAGKGLVQDKGQQKQQQQKQQQQQQPPPPAPRQDHQVGEGEVLVSPKKKAQAPQKRTRKVTDKAAAANGEDFEVEEEDEAVKKPKKQGNNGTEKKTSVKRAEMPWHGEEYSRIIKVTECDGEEDGLFRVAVLAKKPGRGHWQELGFSLDSTQLASIDNLPQQTKAIVTASFQKALTAAYGSSAQRWPPALRLALGGTVWARDMLPGVAAAAAVDEGDEEGAGGGHGLGGDFEGLGDSDAGANANPFGL
jgi:hypothetical protein